MTLRNTFFPPRSVKDRIAYSMIASAEQQGRIKPGETLLVGWCVCVVLGGGVHTH